MPLFFPWTNTPYNSLNFIHCIAAVSSLSSEKRTISALLFAITFLMSAKGILLGKNTLTLCIFHVHITVSEAFPATFARSSHLAFFMSLRRVLLLSLCYRLLSPVRGLVVAEAWVPVAAEVCPSIQHGPL